MGRILEAFKTRCMQGSVEQSELFTRTEALATNSLAQVRMQDLNPPLLAEAAYPLH